MNYTETYEKVVAYIHENYANDIQLPDLAEVAGCSVFALVRIFNKNGPLSPMRFLWNYRAEVADSLLRNRPELPVSAVQQLVGFNSPQHFSRYYRSKYATTPGSARKAGASDGQVLDQ